MSKNPMWLERFSGHSTPSQSPPPSQRGYSPAPRRSFQAQRPGLNPRQTSLSFLSNASTSSLSGTAKVTPGSALKNQINTSPPENVEDPLAALERLVGTALARAKAVDGSDRGAIPGKPEELVQHVKFSGRSLQDFVKTPRSQNNPYTPAYSHQSVEEYERERDQYNNLHKSITECDDVLKSVETYLTTFQADLGAVSAEIETLQSRSTALNAKLENRKGVEKLLGPVVEQISLSPHLVRKIADGPVDEAWVKSLEELQARTKALESDGEPAGNIKAANDLKPLLSDLSNKAVERIRDYFAARIRSIRSPNINAQIIQKQDFLPYKTLFAFLAAKQPQLAEEINQAYTNTARWYYHTHFSRYRDALAKLKLQTTDRNDVLGSDPSTRTPSAPLATNTAKLPSHDPFSLGRRLDILRTPSGAALPAQTAEESKTPTHAEIPFLSYNTALLDNASAEYSFLANLLPAPLNHPQRVSRQIVAIFSPAFDLGHAQTKLLFADSLDALGILLAVRLTQHFAFTLQRRRIPALDTYVNGTNMLLWPRFQQVLDANCDSIKRLAASLPSRPGAAAGGPASAAFATLSGATPVGPSTAPHPVTQRFANLLRGILALSAEARDDEPVGSSVARLRETFEVWIGKMAGGFGSGEKGRRGREAFLASNYGLVVAVLEGPDVKGKLAEDCRRHFESARGVV